QRALPEPQVVADAEALQAGRQAFDHPLDGVAPEPRLSLRLGLGFDPGQVSPGLLGDLGDVGAGVATLGRLLPVQPGVDGGAEPACLGVLVVDVVLAGDLVGGELEQAAESVAEDDATTVPDVQRACRIDAGELDV